MKLLPRLIAALTARLGETDPAPEFCNVEWPSQATTHACTLPFGHPPPRHVCDCGAQIHPRRNP